MKSPRPYLPLFALAASLLLAAESRAQVILTENFNFTGALTANGWVAANAGGSNAITAAAPSLSYSNLPSSGTGNPAGLTTSGEDDYKLFTTNNSTGDLYTSFLITVSAAQATGDYFYSFYSTNSSGGGYFGRIFAKANSTGFSFGVAKSGTPVTYETNVRTFGTTYLIVSKMTRVAGATTNDISSLWINPPLGAAETVTDMTNIAGSDNANSLAAVALRQGSSSASATARVGNILVGTTWSSVTPSSSVIPPTITSFSPTNGVAGTVVTIAGSSFTGSTNVAFNGVSALFTVDSDTQITATVPATATAGPITVTSSSGVVGTSSNSFFIPTVAVVLPSQINEGGAGIGTVTLNEAPVSDVTVTLSSDHPTKLVVPASVIIYSGTTSSDFDFSAPPDGTVGPDVLVKVTPTATGYAAAPASINVINIDATTISLSSTNANSYQQNFDILGLTTFTNSTTTSLGAIVSTNLDGWFAARLSTSPQPTSIVANDGSSSSGAVYNYGSTNTNGAVNLNRSLGGLATGSLTPGFGALLANNTGQTLNSVIISFTGKFWRSSTSAQNVLTFGYGKIDGTNFTGINFLTAAGASLLPAANVVGPLPVASNAALDGNDPTNQTHVTNVAIPVTLAPGEQMFVRWQDTDNAGSDAGLAIDDLSLTASTEVPKASLGSVTIDPFSLTQSSASASSSVVSEGGSSVTERGFVFAQTSVNSDPSIGGTGVSVVTNEAGGLGAFTNTLAGLTASTGYTVKSYAVNAQGTSYSTTTAFTSLAPSPTFSGAYYQSFDGFTNMAAMPNGWRCLSTSNVDTYAGNWNNTNAVAAGFYGRTNIPGVLGYLHTGGTGVLSNRLTLANGTGGTLTNLFISYMGEMNLTNNTRFPSWTVVVNGQTNATLAYSTGVGSNEFKSAEVTGLSITNGGAIDIVWWSDRGTNAGGSSRMIGMTSVRVATTAVGTPTVAASGTFTNFSSTVGVASSSQPFTVGGTNLLGPVTVVAPTYFQVSSNNTNFSSSLQLLPSSGGVPSTTLYARIGTNAPAGPVSGNIASSSLDAATQNLAISGNVTTPTISVSGALSPFVTTLGTASASQSFTASGADLAGNITVTAPTDYEVSTDNSSFSPSVSLVASAGTVPSTLVYVRLSAGAAQGASSGNVSLTSSGATTQNVAVSGTVNPSGGSTYTSWAQGAPLNATNQLLYSIGGATSPTATNGVASVTTLSNSVLSITAVVRTNDPNLSVLGLAAGDLRVGPWSTNGVTATNAANQTNAPEGCAIRVFSTDRGTNAQKYMRLESILLQ